VGKDGAKLKELTIVGGKTPRACKRSRRDWTKSKEETFLSTLAETCNVSEACRQTKVPMTVVYRRRKMDAAFRAARRGATAIATNQAMNKVFIGHRTSKRRAAASRPRPSNPARVSPGNG